MITHNDSDREKWQRQVLYGKPQLCSHQCDCVTLCDFVHNVLVDLTSRFVWDPLSPLRPNETSNQKKVHIPLLRQEQGIYVQLQGPIQEKNATSYYSESESELTTWMTGSEAFPFPFLLPPNRDNLKAGHLQKLLQTCSSSNPSTAFSKFPSHNKSRLMSLSVMQSVPLNRRYMINTCRCVRICGSDFSQY